MQPLVFVTSAENIRTILESDFARKVHPIREYFNALPLLNPAEHGHIGRLLNTVQVANPGKWEEYFTKWLVGVVANAMNDTGCQNHTCLVLTGDRQGQFKSWWLDNLCPTPLKNYLFTGKIDPQGKDILTLIAEYLFINIDDQLKELNKQNENALKNLITTPAVKYRRPYDIYIEEYPPPRQLHGFGERQRVPDRPDRQQAFFAVRGAAHRQAHGRKHPHG